MRLILATTLLCVLRSGVQGAIMKKVPGLGYIYNSSYPQTRRSTTPPSGEFDPNLSIQKLMNEEKRYHAVRIPEKIYMQMHYHIYNETEAPWMVKFLADAQRIIDMRKNVTFYENFATGKPKNATYVPKRVFHRRRNFFLHGTPTTYDPTLPELYWTYYLKNFEPNSQGEVVVAGWKKKEVITRSPKRPDTRLKGARAKLAEMDIWGIYAHLLTPKPKIKWTPNLMKMDFNFDHQAMFLPPEENTVWILPATKSWEMFDIEDPSATTRKDNVFIPAWLRGQGLNPEKKGKGGFYNIAGKEYKEWEVPIKYRSLSPDLLTKYYQMFDDKGRRLRINQTFPQKWGTVPYGKTFTYKMEITNEDGSVNKTIWKRNAGFVTKKDGSILMVKDMKPEEKIRYLGSIAPGDFVDRIVEYTNADGSFNYSTVVQDPVIHSTFPTAWVNFTDVNGSMVRLWKFVKPAITTKVFIKKTTTPPQRPTETVRYTHPNGSVHRIFWKYAKATGAAPTTSHSTDDPAYQFIEKAGRHKQYQIVTYADGGFRYTTEYVPQLLNRTAYGGAVLFSYYYVPKVLRENVSSTDNYKLITNKYGELVRVVTYRPKLFKMFTNHDGSLNYSEKVADFNAVKAKHYTAYDTVNHTFPNGSFDRTHYVHNEFSAPSPRKYYGYAATQVLNFTNLNGEIVGTFWRIVKNLGEYTGTGETHMHTFKNKRGALAHSFWREIPKFTNRDDKLKPNDVTEIRYVTRRDGFLYGSFKKKLRLYTTPMFRPYTGNASTRVGFFTYPNGTVYGSHWQVIKNVTNPIPMRKGTPARLSAPPARPFSQSILSRRLAGIVPTANTKDLQYMTRILYQTDYQGNVKNSYSKLFSYRVRSTPTQYKYTGQRSTKLLRFTNKQGQVYGSHWVFDDHTPTLVVNKTSKGTTPYYTYQGPRETRIVNFTNKAGRRIASFWLFVTDPFDSVNRSTTTLPPLVTHNKRYNAFYFDPGFVSTVEPPRTHSEWARLKDEEDGITELPFSTYAPGQTRIILSTAHEEVGTATTRQDSFDTTPPEDADKDAKVKEEPLPSTMKEPSTTKKVEDVIITKATRKTTQVTTEGSTQTTSETTTKKPSAEIIYESSSEYDSEPKAQTVGPSDPRHGERKRRSFNDEAPGKGLRKRRHLRNAMNEKVPQNVNENVLENGNNNAANVGGPFFRRAYSGGRVAQRKVRRDVDDEVDFGEGMGKDIFDRDPEEEGGDMLDSLELPNAKPFKDKGREGKVDVHDKVTDDGVNVDLSSEYDDPLQESGRRRRRNAGTLPQHLRAQYQTDPPKSTSKWHSTTLNLTVEAAIKRAKKEARKFGLMLEKWGNREKKGELEDEHFAKSAHEPFYFQKTSTQPITVFSWEATETGEEVLGYDSYENLTLEERFNPINKSGELWWQLKNASAYPVDLHPDRFQPFMPERGPDGKFLDNWYQKLPDGRTFDHPVKLEWSSTTPQPEYYYKTEISLEQLRYMREMYQEVPHMRKKLVEAVQGNEALLNSEFDKEGQNSDLDHWETTMKSGELYYICATTVPNHRIPDSIECFRPATLWNGEFEKDWYQVLEGKTYKKPVNLVHYYSLPTTKQVFTRRTTWRIQIDDRIREDVYDEKWERFAKLMAYDERTEKALEKGEDKEGKKERRRRELRQREEENESVISRE